MRWRPRACGEATYRHSYESEKRGALGAWARHVEGLITGKPAENIIELARVSS